MNCRDAGERLDRMIFEGLPMDEDLKKHLEDCPGCSGLFSHAADAREAIGTYRRSAPELKDPESLTEEIMRGILQGQEHKTARLLPLFQRLLAAASVALFLLLGYEQYVVVEKITRLETQSSLIKTDPHYSNPQQMASAFDISKAGISFRELEKMLSKRVSRPLVFSSAITKRFITKQ
jgi:predicted anti-sigma-YlaC factor YlaD